MNYHRKLTVVALTALAMTNTAAADYPTKPIRLVVPLTAGGAVDIVSRVVAERLAVALGRQIVVDNRPGGDGMIALDMVAKATADGYTLVAVTDFITMLPSLYRKLSFDPQASFSPIILMSTQPRVLAVHPSITAANFKEFVALAKSKPGALSFASGTAAHRLTGELINKMAGVDMLHVPYKGGAQAVVDLVGGQVPVAVLGLSPVLPQARAGKVRMLAVTTGTRSAIAPNIPTLVESGLSGFDVSEWIALLAPAFTPKEIITRLNGEASKILSQPAVRERLATASLEARTGSPKEIELMIRDEQTLWGKLVTERGLKSE
jgi:tripartite-type tricarboxylate transporter receptor subunit TctC